MLVRAAALAAGLGLALAPVASAKPAATGGVMAPIHQFIDSFNKGDAKSAEAAHLADVTIIDEPPPHIWRGPKAFESWAADLEKDGKAHDQSGQQVTLGKVVRTQVDGDTGYAVVHATYSYTEKGVPMTEPAQMVFALKKAGGAWKIAGWTWTGTVPKQAPAPAAATAAPAKP